MTEFLTRPLNLNPETQELLAAIRAATEPVAVYGRPADEVEQKVRQIGLPLLEDANLARVTIMQYSWFLREVGRLFRTRTGNDLAWHIETVMRKWLDYGLVPNIMQYLVGEVYLKLKAASAGEDKPENRSSKSESSSSEGGAA